MASQDDDRDDVTTDDDITEDEPSCGESEQQTCHDRLQNQHLANKTKKQESSETERSVWCVGEKCEAVFADDGEYYEAVINSICNDEQEVEVTFIGYESEGSATIPIRKLRKAKSERKTTASAVDLGEASNWKESLFCPLSGTEAEEEMRQKYGVLEFYDGDEINEFPKDNVPEPKGKSSFRKQKGKLPITVKSAAPSRRKNKETENGKNRKREVYCGLTEDSTATRQPTTDTEGQDVEHVDIADMMADGFDDEDMERPRFSDTVADPVEPLVLSDPDMNPKVQVPATINRYLRDYQRDGVRFLYRHYISNTGAILGDDMGLGKTVQVISFIAAVLGKTGTKTDLFGKFLEKDAKFKKMMEAIAREKGTFLIVSPSSVVYNWSDELEAWGYFKQDKFHDNRKESVLERVSRGSLDVVLTTYETLRNHLSDLNKVRWLAVIMDEVHRLKESKTQVTMAAKALRVRRRYGLTGTPLQNRLSEFWCVLDWANPGCLGTAKLFNKTFGNPIKGGQKFDANKRELATGRKKSRQFQVKLNEWFLRRTKDLIADQMPKKDEKVVFCALAPFQEEVYRTLLDMPDVDLLRKKDYPCDCGSGEGRGKCCHGLNAEGEELKPLLLRYLKLLLKVANHSALLMPQIKQTDDQRRRAKAICDKVFQRYPEFAEAARCGSLEVLSDPSYSGKMKVLDKLMRVFEEAQSKVLVFSYSTELLNILELYATGRGLVYNRLDGTTRVSQRTQIVRDFNRDPQICLCLVSTAAGCLGLNFTGANVVVIFDPSWNPSRDLQAQDRAYRIGQRRDVLVYRLVSTGTIEEMIYLRQVYKQQLSNIAVGGTNERRYFLGVQGDKDQKGELFGIENLFSLRSEGASLAHDIVKRTEKIEAGFRVANYDVVPPVGAEQQNEETGEEDELEESEACDDPYDLDDLASQYVGDASLSQEPGPSTSRSSQGHHRCAYPDPSLSSGSDTSEQEHYSSEEEGPNSFSASETDHAEHEATHESDSLNELEPLERSAFDQEQFNEDNPKTSTHKSILDAIMSSSEEEDEHTREKLHPKGRAVSKKRNKVTFCEFFTSSSEEDESNCDLKRFVTDEPYTRIKCKSVNQEHEVGQGVTTFGVSKRGRPRKSYNTRKIITNSTASHDENVDSGEDNKNYNKVVIDPSEVSSDHCVSKRFQSRVKTGNRSRTENERPFSKTDHKRKKVEKDSPPKRKKSTTVEDVFRECGVSYVHANKAIVGPSEAENCMSSLAIKEVFDLNLGSQQPANCFMALQESDESDDVGGGTTQSDDESTKKGKGDAEARESTRKHGASQRITKETSVLTKLEKLNDNAVFIGSVPRGIRRQHFREMWRVLGYSSEVDLAEAVLQSDAEERRNMLKRYYLGKTPQLENLPSFNKAVGNGNDSMESTTDLGKGEGKGEIEIEGKQSRKSRRKRSQRKEKLQNDGKNIKNKKSKHEYYEAATKASITCKADKTKENSTANLSKIPVKSETSTSASNVKHEKEILKEKAVTQEGSSVTRDGRDGSTVTRGRRSGSAVTREGQTDADEAFPESSSLQSNDFHSQLVPRESDRPSQSRNSSILDDLFSLGNKTDQECAGTSDYALNDVEAERTGNEVLRERVHRRLNITSVLDDFI